MLALVESCIPFTLLISLLLFALQRLWFVLNIFQVLFGMVCFNYIPSCFCSGLNLHLVAVINRDSYLPSLWVFVSIFIHLSKVVSFDDQQITFE